MTRKYSMFQAPVMAFFNKDFYADVASNWKGSGALYVFLLTSVAWVVSCIAMFAPYASLINNKDAAAYFQQVPQMTIVDGKMTIDKKCPYAIKDPQSGAVIAEFRTEGGSEKVTDADPPFVITSTAIVQSGAGGASPYAMTGSTDAKSEGGTPILKFSELSQSIPKIEMNGQILQEWVNAFLLWVPIAILGFGWPVVFIGHIVQILIYGLFGLMMASGMDKKIPFETAMRMSAIAITPCVLITVLLTVVKSFVPQAGMLMGIWCFASIGVAMAYLWMGLSAMQAPEAAPQPAR